MPARRRQGAKARAARKARPQRTVVPRDLMSLARSRGIPNLAQLMTLPPHFVFQLDQCLDDFDFLFGGQSGATRTFIKQRLAAAFELARIQLANAQSPLASVIPTPEFLTTESVCTPRGERSGVWLGPAFAPELALRDVDVAPGTRFAFALSVPMLEAFLDAYWDWLISAGGRISGTAPDPNGTDELQTTREPLQTPTPQKLRFIVKGVHHAEGDIDVPFVLTNTEVLSVQQSGAEWFVGCKEDSQQLDLDFTEVDLAQAAAIAGLLAIPFGFFGIPSVIDGFEKKKREAQNRRYDISIACRLTTFLPRSIPLRGTQLKIVFPYDRVEISLGETGRGLVASGEKGLLVVLREPTLTLIVPPTTVVNRAIDHRQAVTVRCAAVTTDMLNPLTVSWFADGKPLPTQQIGPTQLQAGVVVDLSGVAVDGQVTKRIRLTVVDADGLRASADATATVVVIHHVERPEKGPIPKRRDE